VTVTGRTYFGTSLFSFGTVGENVLKPCIFCQSNSDLGLELPLAI
jgi:hypothetical protein